jgi:hypothetical protein
MNGRSDELRSRAVSPADSDSRRALTGWPALVVGLVCIGLGLVAVGWNAGVYRHRQPIYDSMSYYSKLHRTMSTARNEGLLRAVEQNCRSSNTVAMPFLIGSLLGLFFEPSRAIGVWIQVAELTWMAISLVVYFRVVRRTSAGNATLLALPFTLMACLYYDNGGLSDFRMDLSLLLMYASTCLWYLIAHASRKPRDYWILGAVAGMAILFRATAPVYLLASLGPIAAIDWLRDDRRNELLAGWARSLAAALAMGGWFYLVNFQYLHYYYVVWNSDANAQLPLAQSVRHVEFAAKHVGNVVAIWFAAAYAIVLTQRKLLRLWRQPRRGLALAGSLADLRPLWMGLSPLVFLVFSGAGENRFVSMPAAFGLLLAALIPLARQGLLPKPGWRTAAWGAVTAASFAAALLQGYQRHQPGKFDSMSAHRTVVQAIVDDARRLGQPHARYAALHLHELNTTSLQNVLLFDMPGTRTHVARTICQDVQLMPQQVFFQPADADWRQVPGKDDRQKESHLVKIAGETVDYLIVPAKESLPRIQDHVSHFVINRHLRRLRDDLIASGDWVPITGPIVNGPWETVEVWRNSHVRVVQAGTSLGAGISREVRH